MGAHIQVFDAKVNAVGTSLQSCCKALLRPYGCHDFKVFSFHAFLGFAVLMENSQPQ